MVAAVTRRAPTAATERRAGDVGREMPLSDVIVSGMRRSTSGRKRTTQTRPTCACRSTRSKGKVNP